MESILSFDKDKDKTKDLFQDIYRSEKIIITIAYFACFYPKVLFQNRNELMQKYAFHFEAVLGLLQNSDALFHVNEMQNIDILLRRE